MKSYPCKGEDESFFDYKNGNLDELVELIRKYSMIKECFFWFSEDDQAWELKTKYPEIALKMNASLVKEMVNLKSKYNPAIIETDYSHVTPEIVKKCHVLGMKLIIITCNNDSSIFEGVVMSGCYLVNLNLPDQFIKVYNQLNKN